MMLSFKPNPWKARKAATEIENALAALVAIREAESLRGHSGSPEATVRAFARKLHRDHGEDASRLIDIAVAEVQRALRGIDE